MKRLILSFALVLVALVTYGQEYVTDTLTNADTIAHVLGDWNRQVEYSVHVESDSLSGATAATLWVQRQNCATCSDWVTIDTVTIDGVSTSEIDEGTIPGGRLRLYMISSGTQSTKVNSYVIVRRKGD